MKISESEAHFIHKGLKALFPNSYTNSFGADVINRACAGEIFQNLEINNLINEIRCNQLNSPGIGKPKFPVFTGTVCNVTIGSQKTTAFFNVCGEMISFEEVERIVTLYRESEKKKKWENLRIKHGL